jgi:hypothetical protein
MFFKINLSNIFGMQNKKKMTKKINALMGIEPRHVARSPHAYHYTNRSSCQVLHSKSKIIMLLPNANVNMIIMMCPTINEVSDCLRTEKKIASPYTSAQKETTANKSDEQARSKVFSLNSG